MKQHTSELQPPPEVAAHKDAREVLRVWVMEEGGIYAIDPEAFPDPAMWGLVLADIARHAASAIAGISGKDSRTILAEIVQILMSELKAPTEIVTGRLGHR